ncbi:MAG: hypothetical protein R3F33_05850, partial [Planctomycetota bacterium]
MLSSHSTAALLLTLLCGLPSPTRTDFQEALARAQQWNQDGDKEAALRVLFRARADGLLGEADWETWRKAVLAIDGEMQERLSSERGHLKILDKIIEGYEGAGLPGLAEDMRGLAASLRPPQGSDGAEGAPQDPWQQYFAGAQAPYGEPSWVLEGGTLTSPGPNGGTQLWLGKGEVQGPSRITFDVLLGDGLGQAAIAFGVKDLNNYYVAELEATSDNLGNFWLYRISDNAPLSIGVFWKDLPQEQRTDWMTVELELNDPWFTWRHGEHVASALATGLSMSGPIGFFVSGGTTSKAPISIRNLKVEPLVHVSAAPAASSPGTEDIEQALANLEAKRGVPMALQQLWARRYAMQRDGVPAKLQRKVARALDRNDPEESRRHQLCSRLGRWASTEAAGYHAQGRSGLARDLLLDIESRLPDLVEWPAGLEREEVQVVEGASPVRTFRPVDMPALFAGAKRVQGGGDWTFKNDQLQSPKPETARAAQTLVSIAPYPGEFRAAFGVNLGAQGESAFLFGYENDSSYHSMETRVSEDGWFTIDFWHLTATGAQRLQHWSLRQADLPDAGEWVDLQLAVDAGEITLSLEDLPP